MSIFVRFRKLDGRLRISVAETRRVGGKIQQRHIIGLGSIALPRTKTVPIEARVGFWRGLEDILDTVGDRIDRATRAKILNAIAVRIPRPKGHRGVRIEPRTVLRRPLQRRAGR
jgi:hypothetical protein